MTTRPLSRVEPALPSQHMKTYAIRAPLSTHFEAATCEMVDCHAWRHGWKSVIDEGTDLGRSQAYYIRNDSKRGYREERRGAVTTFWFEPGQRCFAQHTRRIPRPELFIVSDGDWRSSTNVRRHANGADWVDDFRTHQDKLSETLRRG